jgi:hypothetical protein
MACQYTAIFPANPEEVVTAYKTPWAHFDVKVTLPTEDGTTVESAGSGKLQ